MAESRLTIRGLRVRTVDVPMPHPHRTAIAAASGRLVSSHLFVEISTHLLGATPTAHWLEYADWFNPVIAEPLRIVDGLAVPADRPGSGVEWNEDAVARYAAG